MKSPCKSISIHGGWATGSSFLIDLFAYHNSIYSVDYYELDELRGSGGYLDFLTGKIDLNLRSINYNYLKHLFNLVFNRDRNKSKYFKFSLYHLKFILSLNFKHSREGAINTLLYRGLMTPVFTNPVYFTFGINQFSKWHSLVNGRHIFIFRRNLYDQFYDIWRRKPLRYFNERHMGKFIYDDEFSSILDCIRKIRLNQYRAFNSFPDIEMIAFEDILFNEEMAARLMNNYSLSFAHYSLLRDSSVLNIDTGKAALSLCLSDEQMHDIAALQTELSTFI